MLILMLLKRQTMGKTLLYLMLFLLINLSVKGQHLAPGYAEAEPSWLEQLLYRGVEWKPRMTSVAGNEFFLTDAYIDGTVTVGGLTFTGQKIKYDIFNDKLVVLWMDINAVVLNSNDVDGFSFGSGTAARRFINLREDYRGISGFAEVIYRGNSMVVVRHTKVIGKNTSMSAYAQFRENTQYYFISGGEGRHIRNRGAFLDRLGERGVEVKRYIRQNHILVSKSSPEGFGLAAAFYDSLISGGEAKN